MTRKALVWLCMSCMVLFALGCFDDPAMPDVYPLARTASPAMTWMNDAKFIGANCDECDLFCRDSLRKNVLKLRHDHGV